jgi:hypothetical protein
MSKRPGSTHLCSGNVSTVTVFAADIKKDIAAARRLVSQQRCISRRPRAGDGSVKIVKKLVGAKPYSKFKTAIDSILQHREVAGRSSLIPFPE